MSTQPDQPGGVVRVHLDRTIAAVRAALPEPLAAEFSAVMDSIEVVELPSTFEYWYHRAIVAQVPGLSERVAAGRLSTGRGVPAEDVLPGFAELVAARQAAA